MTKSDKAKQAMLSSNLKVKIAWLYYVESMTQEQIAELLQISRVKVMRTLAACTEEGIVVTTINRATANQIALERALEQRWKLSASIVVPTPSDPAHLEAAIGHAIAQYLDEEMVDGMTLAIGGGASLHASLKFITRKPLKDASIVALVGSLPHARWINPSIVASRVAEIYQADSYQITAPVIVDEPELRDALWRQDTLKDVRSRAERADIALLTVGSVSADATVFQHDIVPAAQMVSLQKAGAVANLLCYFINDAGELVDHPVNRQVMAMDLTMIARTPRVVLAAGGINKVPAIRAALKMMSAKVLITDSDTAQALIDVHE